MTNFNYLIIFKAFNYFKVSTVVVLVCGSTRACYVGPPLRSVQLSVRLSVPCSCKKQWVLGIWLL